ncbi:hypothetical protein [Aquabacterium sp.]|uniref:hypothetical protein n=1 Tax=Aquabacterium sp. TaxID=1872578 RepID=UPI0035C763E4
MFDHSRPPAAQVPTLTEVIEVDGVRPADVADTGAPLAADADAVAQWSADELAALEGAVTQRVLGDVQRQIDGMLEFRLREAMAPVLARHSEAMVRDLKDELARTLRDVVARSVAQEVAKLRQR